MAATMPLNHEASADPTNLQITSTLPSEVVQCLQNARFLHLATCTELFPHVSLMNYTYLPSSPYTSQPTIIMTTNPSSKKTQNLISNPHVSLLVHDWVSHRPPTTHRRSSTTTRAASERAGSPPPEASRSSLAALLLNFNTSALSSISATINGEARLVEAGTEEEAFYREMHLDNNTFGEEGEDGGGLGGGFGGGGRGGGGRGLWDDAGGDAGDGGRGIFLEGEEVRVVVVRIRDGRVADWKGAVRDWSLSGVEDRDLQGEVRREGGNGLVNGV